MSSNYVDKNHYYFNNDPTVKILKMDSVTYGSSKDETLNDKLQSRNFNPRKTGMTISKTISSSVQIQSDKAKCIFANNHTPAINERANLSIDEKFIWNKINSCGDEPDQTRFLIEDSPIIKNKIVHEGTYDRRDKDYMSSINQSKSLSTGIRLSK